MTELTLKINGEDVTADVETRLSLADFIRDHRRLTGTHLGCEHGVCGACTVLMNGEPVRSCITFAVVADGTEITTIEGFEDDDPMTLLRQAFHENHALQCGYCTTGARRQPVPLHRVCWDRECDIVSDRKTSVIDLEERGIV